MDKLLIKGGRALRGEVKISGAKNAVLPIMTATIINPGKYCLKNVPHLRDTITMLKLLKMIGAKTHFENNIMEIDTSLCNNPVAPYDLVKTMRASFYVLGPFMSRFGHAEVSLPGGCAWGPRPVNYHISALEKLGAKIKLNNGMIIAKGKLTGTEIVFENTSVGATGNILMAAVTGNGKTTIRNAALEPDIIALVEFLKLMGAEINGEGTDTIVINGHNDLNANIEYNIIPDRIEAATFLIAAAITKGKITLVNANPEHIQIIIDKLRDVGAKISLKDESITIDAQNIEIKPVDIRTDVYPGFPTDTQAQWMALMTKAKGSSTIIDDVYKDRFSHIPELSRFGAKISLNENIASVIGQSKLYGAPVMSTDIRASASLIIGALASEGESIISRIYHIDRGYEKIEKKLQQLGAEISRIK